MGCISSKNENNNFQLCYNCNEVLHHKNMNMVIKPQLKGKYYCEKCFYRSKKILYRYI